MAGHRRQTEGQNPESTLRPVLIKPVVAPFCHPSSWPSSPPPAHVFRQSASPAHLQCASNSCTPPVLFRLRTLSSRASSGAISSAVFFLFGHSRKIPDRSVFSTRYGLPHSGHFSGTELAIRRKVALRIIRAAPEHVPPPSLALRQVPGPALGALQPFNQVLLHILALRITRAGNKLPKSPLPQHQRLAASRAILARRLRSILLLLLLLAQLPERLAGRIFVIPWATHERPEDPAPQHHHPPAVIAVLFLSRPLPAPPAYSCPAWPQCFPS